MEVHEALRVCDGHALEFGDGDEQFFERVPIVVGIAGEECINVLGGEQRALRGFGDLNDGKQRVPLSGVFAHDGEHEVRAAAADAGDIFHPVIGLAGDDMQPGLRERLTVGERSVRDDGTERASAK